MISRKLSFVLSLLATTASAAHRLGSFQVDVRHDPPGLTVSRQGRTLLAPAEGPLLEERRFRVHGASLFGAYRFMRRDREAFAWDRVLEVTEDPDQLRVVMGASARPEARAHLTLRVAGAGRLRAEVRREGAGGRGAFLRFARGPGDRFLGFGEQYARVDHTGRVVPVWVSEQGIGRHGAGDAEEAAGKDSGWLERPEWTRGFSAQSWKPWVGRDVDTYYPVPSFLDPGKGLGFLLDADQRSVFDLAAADPSAWGVEVWEPEAFGFEVAAGPAPLDVVEQLSEAMGRPRLPPPWAFGTWLAVEGGEATVRAAVARAREFGVALGAVWCQDWVGRRRRPILQNVRYHWEVDRETYPDIEGLISDLHAEGVRFLGYVNPFLGPEYPSFAEARRKGYMVGRPWRPGRPFVMWHSTFAVGLVDFTDADARAWFQGFLERMLDLGMDGWMADYGEWVPWAGKLEGGEGAALHNRYPGLYQQAVAEVLDRRRPDGDFVLLTRSGYAGAQRHQQVVWAGDQESTWDGDDGLRTVPRAAITAGMAGIPFFTHDVGGYSGGPRSKELFLRWTELGAFTPVLRTHEGLLPGRNWQWDSDDETTAAFARLTRVHEVVARQVVAPHARRAAETGRPLMRHLVLHYPDQPRAWTVDDQYLLGPDLLVAPVMDEGATGRRVWFPPGTWHRIWDGATFEGPAEVEVEAPLGFPPAFSRVAPTRLLGQDWAPFMER